MNPVLLAFHPGAIASVLAFGALFALVFWYWSRKSIDPPGVLTIKIILSSILGIMAVWTMVKLHPMLGVPIGAICGICIAILWGRNIGSAVASPLANLYDGGQEEPEQKPFYAIAEAHRKQARYAEAVAEIEKQLDRFPGDAQGLLILAEIQARHLSDWEAASATIERVIAQSELAVATRARALQALADWNLDFRQDGAAAREVLSRIPELFPGTPEAAEADQRLAHLGDDAWRRERRTATVFRVVEGDPHLGLKTGRPGTTPREEAVEEDPQCEADRLLAQLAEHPRDYEARERLAAVYADRMSRPDWALAQWDLLVSDDAPPQKLRAKWLHQVADLHVRRTHDEGLARAALERIGVMFPGTALEAQAKTRLEHLRLEMRGQERATTVGRKLSAG